MVLGQNHRSLLAKQEITLDEQLTSVAPPRPHGSWEAEFSHPARLYGNCDRLEISGLESQAESGGQGRSNCAQRPSEAQAGARQPHPAAALCPRALRHPRHPAHTRYRGPNREPRRGEPGNKEATDRGQQGWWGALILTCTSPRSTAGLLVCACSQTGRHRKWLPVPRTAPLPQLRLCPSPSVHLPLGQRPSHASCFHCQL